MASSVESRPGAKLRILHVEADPVHSEIVAAALRAGGIEHETFRVDTEEALRTGLERGSFDLVLSELALPFMDGMAALAMVRQRFPELPFIVLAESGDAPLTSQALRGGATDYVLNTDLSQLVPAVLRALRETDILAQRRLTELELRDSERRWRLMFESASDAVLVLDAATGRVLEVNDAGVALFGYTRQQLLRLLVTDLFADPFAAVRSLCRALDEAGMTNHRLLRRNRDGAVVPVDMSAGVFTSTGRTVVCCCVRQTDDELHDKEECSGVLFDHILAGVYRSTVDGRMLDCNESFAKIFGFGSRAEVLATRAELLYDDPGLRARLIEALRISGPVSGLEQPMKRRDGRRVWCAVSARLVEDDDGQLSILEGSVIDVTERRQLREQLERAQKLEALGQLVGGVAHDFSNLLSAVAASADLLASRLADTLGDSWELDTIRHTVEQGTQMTRQLLTIASQQARERAPVDVNNVVSGEIEMLRRVIPETIEISFAPATELPTVVADQGQLSQVLLNLVVNARDAMPAGGVISITTESITIDSMDACVRPGAWPGSYVRISVSDTGCGMDPLTLSRVFEPFFTTKEEGKGTGMGLATVYGIVAQHGGFIEVASELAKGSDFSAYLPAGGEPLANAPVPVGGQVAGGSETVLVVEDDPPVRQTIAGILDHLGYRVMEAADGAEALEIIQQSGNSVNLVITDVIMPRMGGIELYERVREINPTIVFLFSSGYTNRLRERLANRPGISCIDKPFGMDGLAAKVREALERPVE